MKLSKVGQDFFQKKINLLTADFYQKQGDDIFWCPQQTTIKHRSNYCLLLKFQGVFAAIQLSGKYQRRDDPHNFRNSASRILLISQKNMIYFNSKLF